VAYVVRFRGDAEAARDRIAPQPWVTEIQPRPLEEGNEWFVTVSDAEAAEHQLMRLLLEDAEVTVWEFRRRAYELEDVFTTIVEGGHRDGK
jgi:hypothetical protein